MKRRTAAALSAALLAAALTGCGPTDAELNEAQAIAELQARPAPKPTMTLRPCPGGEILRQEPGGMTSIKVDCYDAALAEAIAEFPQPLPDGVDWYFDTSRFTSTDPKINPNGWNIAIEDGNQDLDVAYYWFCAWIGSYLQAGDNGDTAGRDEAVAHLATFTSLPALQAYVDNLEVYDATVIAPAQSGDTATVRDYFRGSCSNVRVLWFPELNV